MQTLAIIIAFFGWLSGGDPYPQGKPSLLNQVTQETWAVDVRPFNN
jgi:hypothetical protein